MEFGGNFFFSVICGIIADSQGRSVFWGFLFGFLFGILAMIVYLIIGDKE